jgi:hypothetical protein
MTRYSLYVALFLSGFNPRKVTLSCGSLHFLSFLYAFGVARAASLLALTPACLEALDHRFLYRLFPSGMSLLFSCLPRTRISSLAYTRTQR